MNRPSSIPLKNGSRRGGRKLKIWADQVFFMVDHMMRSLFFILISFIVFGCENDEASYNIKNVDSFKLDSPNGNKIRSLQGCCGDELRYLVFHSKNAYDNVSRIKFYDLDKRRVSTRIDLTESSDLEGSISDLIAFGPDSLLICTRRPREGMSSLYVIDSSSKVLRTSDFPNEGDDANGVKVSADPLHGISRLDGKLIAPLHPTALNDKNRLYETPIFSFLNLEKGEISKIFGRYPKIYNKLSLSFQEINFTKDVDPVYSLIRSYTLGANKRIYSSFSIMDTIYVYSRDGDLVDKKVAGIDRLSPSKNIRLFKSWLGKNEVTEKMNKELKRNGFYTGLIYDEFDKLFYRKTYVSDNKWILSGYDSTFTKVFEKVMFNDHWRGDIIPYDGGFYTFNGYSDGKVLKYETVEAS